MLGQVNGLVGQAFSRRSCWHDRATRPTDLVPNHVRADLAVAVAVLEQHGRVVADALRQLDR
jgi:hypothetical protein